MYGGSTMPDQYVLDYIYRHEIRHRTQPLFIEVILATSHAPFHHQPPYLKNWSWIGEDQIYQEFYTVTFPIVEWKLFCTTSWPISAQRKNWRMPNDEFAVVIAANPP